MIDFPLNPTPNVTTHTVGRKTWKCVGLDGNGKGIWDLTSTPDSFADQVANDRAAVEALFVALPGSGGSGLIGWIHRGIGAVQRWVQDKLRDDVNVLDYIPDAEHAAIRAGTSTYDAAADIQRALNAHTHVSIKGGITVCIASPVGWTSDSVNRRYTLNIEGGSCLKALPGFAGSGMFILDATADANMPLNFAVTGTGTIDCSDVAQRGVFVRIGGRGNIGAIEIKNPTLYGIHVGDSAKATASYEVNTRRALVWRQSSLGHNNDANSIGVYYDKVTDSVISDVVSTGFRVGGKSNSASITWDNFHPWSVTGHGPMVKGLWVAGQDAIITSPYADTPHSRNFDGTIDASITDVYGLFLDGYGAQVADVKVFLNQAHAVDNVATGIWINKNDGLFGSIKGARYTGGTTAKYKRYIGQLGRGDIAGTTVLGQFGSGSSIAYDANNIADYFYTVMFSPGATFSGDISVSGKVSQTDRSRITTSFAGYEAIHSSNPVNPLYQHGYRWALNNDDTYRLQYTSNLFSAVSDRLIVNADGSMTFAGDVSGIAKLSTTDRLRITTGFAGMELIHSANAANGNYQIGFRWALNNDRTLRLQYTTNNFASGVQDRVIVNEDGGVQVVGKVGFNNATPLAKPTITGSRGANAALASLLTQLANYGLIVDGTTA